jgi:hypothetical protein
MRSVLLVPTHLACLIAGVSRTDFYNAGRNGYPPAPPHLASPYRVFQEADLIGLAIFAHLRRRGMSVPAACATVAEVVERLRGDGRDRDTISVLATHDGQIIPDGEEASEIVLNIAWFREFVRRRAADLDPIAAE